MLKFPLIRSMICPGYQLSFAQKLSKIFKSHRRIALNKYDSIWVVFRRKNHDEEKKNASFTLPEILIGNICYENKNLKETCMVGEFVGDVEGGRGGIDVGLWLGSLLGQSVGRFVGSNVGSRVGSCVGSCIGLFVGG